MSTPPDYGEPWEATNLHFLTAKGNFSTGVLASLHSKRIAQCVNACQNMTDPAAEIQAMREAIKEAISQLDEYIHFLRSCDGDVGDCKRVIAKLQPLIK